MNGLLYTMPIPDHPTPNRAICFAAKEALVIANILDPSGKKKLIINTRYQGLVHSMASHRGKARWVDRWQQNQWRKTNGQRVVNRDVIQVLVAAEMYRSQTMWHFIDKHNTPEWMMKLHQQTHEEAKRMARRFLEEK
ncbi:Ribonuclease [Phytophthora megakarya]|uniref:Ribonuclease n=1 Tax=Phytophthora megakarya TaxID=4795 RepID=A0A225UV25_9STRA|nr:Ribonuclease [Phytophthora megakarya]